MLADAGLPRGRLRGPEGRADERRSTIDGDGTVTIDQVQGADGIPGFAKKFVGDDDPDRSSEERWTAPTHGDVTDRRSPASPARSPARSTLAAAGDGATETVDLEIKVKIPLVGGKIETLIGRQARRARSRPSTRVGRTWLEGHGMKFHTELRYDGAAGRRRRDARRRRRSARRSRAQAGADSYDVTVDAGRRRRVRDGRRDPAVLRRAAGRRPEVRRRREHDPPGGDLGRPRRGRARRHHPRRLRRDRRRGRRWPRIGEATVQTDDLDIDVHMPLVGRKVEKLVGQVLGNLLKLQSQVGSDWLAGKR